MQRTIKCELSSSGIQSMIDRLEDLRKALNTTAQNAAERIATRIGSESEQRFQSAVYDGTNDVEVTVDGGGFHYRVNASGEAVLFIEFGTGINFPESKAGLPPGIVPHGQYGHHQASRGWWLYPEEKGYGTNGTPFAKKPGLVLARGNPANDCLYSSAYEVVWPDRAIIAEEEIDNAFT